MFCIGKIPVNCEILVELQWTRNPQEPLYFNLIVFWTAINRPEVVQQSAFPRVFFQSRWERKEDWDLNVKSGIEIYSFLRKKPPIYIKDEMRLRALIDDKTGPHSNASHWEISLQYSVFQHPFRDGEDTVWHETALLGNVGLIRKEEATRECTPVPPLEIFLFHESEQQVIW